MKVNEEETHEDHSTDNNTSPRSASNAGEVAGEDIAVKSALHPSSVSWAALTEDVFKVMNFVGLGIATEPMFKSTVILTERLAYHEEIYSKTLRGLCTDDEVEADTCKISRADFDKLRNDFAEIQSSIHSECHTLLSTDREADMDGLKDLVELLKDECGDGMEAYAKLQEALEVAGRFSHEDGADDSEVRIVGMYLLGLPHHAHVPFHHAGSSLFEMLQIASHSGHGAVSTP